MYKINVSLDRAKDAALALHNDQNLSPEETLKQLKILRDYILDYINAIQEDIERRDMEM